MREIDEAKVALIFEDKTVFLGNNKDFEEMHNMCLLDYAKENFKNDAIFSKLNIRHRPETISYFFNLKGITVFLNITDYKENSLRKYGRSGILLVPNSTSIEQQKRIRDFSKEIEDFDLIVINDTKLVDGMLEHKTIRAFDGEKPEELLTSLFEEDLENIVIK